MWASHLLNMGPGCCIIVYIGHNFVLCFMHLHCFCVVSAFKNLEHALMSCGCSCCFSGFGLVRAPVYLGAPYFFSIKFFITYQKNIEHVSQPEYAISSIMLLGLHSEPTYFPFVFVSFFFPLSVFHVDPHKHSTCNARLIHISDHFNVLTRDR